MDIMTQGARQDRADNSAAIQAAIDEAAARGGGTVRVPPGEWTTGTVELKTNVTLVLEPGAVLRGSPDIAHYPPNPHLFNPQDHKDLQPHHLIHARNARNIRITGGGTIDGNGPAFWHPQEKPDVFHVEIEQRPCPMLHFDGCENLVVDDVTIADSPGWTLHLHEVSGARLSGVRMRNNLYGPNTDGFDITDCKRVRISDCDLVCGDDAIVLKSLGGVNEDIAVTNCTLHTNCSALKLGAQEALGTIRRVVFSNCTVRNSTRGVSLYNVAGGLFEDVAVSNVVMECDNGIPFVCPIHIDGSNHFKPERIVERTGRIRNVSIENVLCRSDARILLTAKEFGAVENIRLSGIQMEYPRVENRFEEARDAQGIQFSPHNPEARAANACVAAENIKGLQLRDIATAWPEDCDVPMHFLWARNCRPVHLDCPLGTASQPGVEPLRLVDSEVIGRCRDTSSE
jgi:polygalacturonase